ncbi:MAG: hypothetical protein AAGA85_25630, partial [Bacteroidota bacterium]
VMGTDAWYKPIKFALSIGIYSWTMAWLMADLETTNSVLVYSWIIVLMLGFEIIYIGLQAGRGELSHFNQSSALYANLYVAMALAATAVTLVTAAVGLQFFNGSFPHLPTHYLWAIRLGILIFVIFSLEGFVMGSRMSHTIGAADGGTGWPFLNWSKKYGDPRVAHFVGMHALQVLPLVSFYLLKSTRWTIVFAACYLLIAIYVLLQALQGRPLIRG